MTQRSRKNAVAIATKTAELAFATPQVVAHRVARMALAGPVLSARDRKEFELMGAEKMAAFTQAWQAMALQTARANQSLMSSFVRSFWSPWSASPTRTAAQLQSAALGVLGKGLAPVHRKATANARRLAGTKLR